MLLCSSTQHFFVDQKRNAGGPDDASENLSALKRDHDRHPQCRRFPEHSRTSRVAMRNVETTRLVAPAVDLQTDVFTETDLQADLRTGKPVKRKTSALVVWLLLLLFMCFHTFATVAAPLCARD